jgi:hypothetical protein
MTNQAASLRRRLPQRRPSTTFGFECSGLRYTLALQHGVPLDVLRKALLRDARGRPSTPIGCALDLIAEVSS